ANRKPGRLVVLLGMQALLVGPWGCSTSQSQRLAADLPPQSARGAAPGEADEAKKPEEKKPLFRMPSLDPFEWFAPEAPPPPADSLTIRADGVVQEKAPAKDSAEARMAGAREYFRRGQYADAESLFKRVADNQKNPSALVEEARYYQGECLRLQGYY